MPSRRRSTPCPGREGFAWSTTSPSAGPRWRSRTPPARSQSAPPTASTTDSPCPGTTPGSTAASGPDWRCCPTAWTLAYAWHAPTRSLDQEGHYDGVIAAKIRLVDLRTGRISPIEPWVPGLRSQLAWLAWNPRWSPDSRFVVSDLTLTFGDDKGIKTDWYEYNSESESSAQRLDASKKRTWTAPGRFEHTGIDKPYGSVPIVNSSGGGAAVDNDGKLHTWRPDGTRRDVTRGYAAWSAGRFSADGRWLLLQPSGLGDSLLALDQATSTTIGLPLLDAAEWPDGAAIDLLGWVDADHAMAILRPRAGAQGAAPDADLVLITLDLAGASADFRSCRKGQRQWLQERLQLRD